MQHDQLGISPPTHVARIVLCCATIKVVQEPLCHLRSWEREKYLRTSENREINMATGAAGDGLLRGLFEGCISGGDMGIQRRPYHRNCNCALHKSRGRCSHPPKNTQVSYPVKRSWSESCLALMTASDSGHSPSVTSPAMGTGPTGDIPRTKSQLALSNLELEKSSSKI